MEDLQTWQYLAIAACFVWSGFVRSGLGFGGAVLTLPFLLMKGIGAAYLARDVDLADVAAFLDGELSRRVPA